MGLSPTPPAGAVPGVATAAGARPGALVPGPVPLAPALAALLGSEDALFRDPFADFVPSGR
jgi:hypothetical protein